MNQPALWAFLIPILACTLVAAVLVLLWFGKKTAYRRQPQAVGLRQDALEPDLALQRWRFWAIAWPLLCLVFGGVIVYQALQGMEERIFQLPFPFIALIFYAIGMAMRRRLLRERRHATCATTATVVSTGRRTVVGEGNKRAYFPQYRFQVGETSYHVTSPSGYSHCFLSEGRQVTLYYAPEDPRLFYVPAMQTHDRRWSNLLCGVGILFPLAGLFAPLLQNLFSFLPG